MKEVESTLGFARQMDEWGAKCYSEPNKARRCVPKNRLKMVPLPHRGGPRRDSNNFDFFIQGTTLLSAAFSLTS
jgi:hypothetical protein